MNKDEFLTKMALDTSPVGVLRVRWHKRSDGQLVYVLEANGGPREEAVAWFAARLHSLAYDLDPRGAGEAPFVLRGDLVH